jgi:ribosomal protein S8E
MWLESRSCQSARELDLGKWQKTPILGIISNVQHITFMNRITMERSMVLDVDLHAF